MAAREAVCLNEATPQLEVPQVGDTYELPRDTNITGNLTVTGTSPGGWTNMTEAVWAGGTQSEVADGASAVAFDFDTDNTYSTAGAKLASWSNNGTERASIGYEGVLSINTPVMGANADVVNIKVNSVEKFTVDEDGDVVIGTGGSLEVGVNNIRVGGVLSAKTCYTLTGVVGKRTASAPLEFKFSTPTVDQTIQPINITGMPAYASATTNLDGGAVNITGGAGASGSAGDADGGDVVISGGQEYGTGSVGNIIMSNLPTSDPTVAGALWNNSGVLTVSSG